MFVSSLDTVPSHETRRRPVGRGRLHQPAAGIVRRRRRCAGSARHRSPAYPAKTASSRRRAGPAAGNDARGGGTTVAISPRLVKASTTVRPALARNAGGAEAAKSAGRTQSAGGPPSVSSKRRAPLRSSWAGRPLDGSGGAAGRAASRSGGSFETTSRAIGRASLPSCSRMGEVEPGAASASMKASARPPGASTMRAVARGERLGRLAVEGHDPDLVALHFHRNDSPLAAIDEAKSKAFMGARR